MNRIKKCKSLKEDVTIKSVLIFDEWVCWINICDKSLKK